MKVLSGPTLVILSVILILVVLRAALGANSKKRVIGLHLPFVGRTEATWVQGHQAALYMVIPTSCVSAILGIVDSLSGAHDSQLLTVGWLIWIGGLGIGSIIASKKAHSVLSK